MHEYIFIITYHNENSKSIAKYPRLFHPQTNSHFKIRPRATSGYHWNVHASNSLYTVNGERFAGLNFRGFERTAKVFREYFTRAIIDYIPDLCPDQ